MSAGIANFLMLQGATFRRVITVRDANGLAINLTGYTARAKMKGSARDADAIAEFVVTITEPLLGKIVMMLPDSVTSLIPASGKYYLNTTKYTYDLELIAPSGDVTRVLNGMIEVSPGVTT